jgi:protein TonB
VTKPAAPAPAKIAEPKPKIEEPKPVVEQPPPKPEKNTVPLSPFGRSTKKGSETPAPAPPPPSTTTMQGSTSTAPEIPIGGSGVTGLEGGDFPYTLYIQGMIRRIGNAWFRPQVPPGTAVVIYFRIQRDGTISEARVETSSGNGTFDRAALSAVRSASPLAPLPFAYAANYLGVHQTFR